MKITPHIHLVGSGAYGLSHADDCNVWLIVTGTTGDEQLALVDSGSGGDTGAILKNVQDSGYDPNRIEYILLTHAHRDHAGGCSALLGELPHCRVFASAAEAELLQHGTSEQLGLTRLGLADVDRAAALPPCAVDVILADRQTVSVGNVEIEGILVPGHNPGCMCYLAEIDSIRVLFAGDTVFCGGYISVGNWPGSDLKMYQQHIGKLSELNIDGLFSGHHVFTVSRGQSHIDSAVQAFEGLWPPPFAHTVL